MNKIHDFPSSARRDLHNVTGWLSDLANLSAGTTPLADAKVKIASLATALVEIYPPAAFTRQSLLAVAKNCKFFPSFAELCAALTPWWNDNRPVLPALPAPYEHVPTPERTRPTTEGLRSIRDLIARNDTFLHAQYDAIYNRANSPTAPAKPETRFLSTEQLAAARKAAGIAGPGIA